MRAFVDTNLWVYRLDRRDPAKAEWVAGWLRDLAQVHDIVVSTQVLIELRSVLTKKFAPALDAPSAAAALAAVASFEVVATDRSLVLDAHALAAAEQFSWFDALIVEAAIRSHCNVLYSEDLQHGRRIDDLQILDPFKSED